MLVPKIRENWFSRKPNAHATYLTYIMALVLILLSGFGDFITASPKAVFQHHEYWRAWTTLFAHSDLGHLLSNAIIVLPLTHLLAGYYGFILFPLVGLFLGGWINLIVLKTLPLEITLLGISGVAYWMGAVWLTLFILIDNRKSLRRRWAYAIFLVAMLFAPEVFRPEVSYLSHFVGFVFGVATALAYYWINRKYILSFEVVEWIDDELLLPTIGSHIQ